MTDKQIQEKAEKYAEGKHLSDIQLEKGTEYYANCRLLNRMEIYDTELDFIAGYNEAVRDNEANATLMSASKELLQALEYALNHFEYDGQPEGDTVACSIMRIAINKAKGLNK